MSSPHVSRRIPPPRPRRGGLDCRLLFARRNSSGPVAGEARRDPRANCRPHAPQQGEAFDQIFADVERVILPGITHWQSPNFYAYFPTSTSGPAILGDLLSTGLGVQGMLWSTSPACTELETHVLDWLVPMLGLPEKFLSTSTGGGVIHDTASSAISLRGAGSPRTGHAVRQQQQRLRRTPCSLCLDADPLLSRESGEDRRHGHRIISAPSTSIRTSPAAGCVDPPN